jgi:hypothetical protein
MLTFVRKKRLTAQKAKEKEIEEKTATDKLDEREKKKSDRYCMV